MSEHPTASTLDALLRGVLPDQEKSAVLAHFAGGCDLCSQTIAPAVCSEVAPLRCPAEPSAADEAGYDTALDAAFALFHERALDLEKERKSAERFRVLLEARRGLLSLPVQLTTWSACEVLLEESFALRYDNPARMVRLACLAVAVADGLDPEHYGRYSLADLRARARAELANAYRVADNFADATVEIAQAWKIGQEGTGDRALRARLMELTASLRCSQRNYQEGFRLLDRAKALYLRCGDWHGAGRVLISKGLYSQYRGHLEQAEALLAEGLKMIDRKRERRFVLGALRNWALILVDVGDFREAHDCLPELRVLHEIQGAGKLDAARFLWLEGRIAAGLGELESAEEKLQQVRVAMNEAELGFASALAALDLAAVWLRQGRTAEMRGLLDQAMGTFVAVNVERETLGGLRMLQEAARQERATVELFETVTGALRRAEHDLRPGAGNP